MTDTITLTGNIATDPRVLTTDGGLAITSFRLASAQRRYDRSKSEWVDGETNWYTVTAFRHLAENAGASLKKGERVLVHGRLRIRSWEADDRSGTTVEVDADSIGHDLAWGRTQFTRRVAAGPAVQAGSAVDRATDTTDEPGGGQGSPAPAPGDPGLSGLPGLPVGPGPTTDAAAQPTPDDPGPSPEDAAWGAPGARGPDEVLAPF